jgi:hypothetical protein
MPTKVRLIEEVPRIEFDKGLFRVHYSTGRTDAYRPHDFMVACRAAQTAIEAWFATVGDREPVDFKRADHG